MSVISLPLTYGCFFVDNSTMELITTCPRAAEYHVIAKRELAAERAAFRFGTHIHHALAQGILGTHEDTQLATLQQNFMNDPCETED